MTKPKSIPDIIQQAGGPDRIIQRAEKLSRWALYKWVDNGIPERHWPLIIELSGLSADELLAANVAVRAREQARAS